MLVLHRYITDMMMKTIMCLKRHIIVFFRLNLHLVLFMKKLQFGYNILEQKKVKKGII